MPTNINFSASEGQFLDGDETNYTAAANGSLSITFDNSSGNFQLLWHLNTDGVAVGDTDGDTDSFSDSGTGTTPLSVSLSNGSSLIAGWSFGSSGNGSAEVTVNPNGGSDFVGTLSITDTTADGTTASYDIPISITAPPITLAELANAAYTTPTPTSINTPDGSYQEIAQTPTGAPFFAEAFKNGNQIVLAIRGTDPSSNYTDFASDNIFINNVLADASWVGAESPNPVLISYISSALSVRGAKGRAVKLARCTV